MTGMVTYVGLDVHARSTHAAAIDVSTGELLRARFGPGVEAPVAWLAGLPGPVRACYEAGPTGFGLYRAATAAGVAVEVIAPGKTPRGPCDRVKTDRKDAELLAQVAAGRLVDGVVVPPVEVEAARELIRAHDTCRRDLMTARHRVSKMLLRHGQVYPESATWTVAHRRWLARQQASRRPSSELVFADLLASVDGLSARKTAIAERLSRLAQTRRGGRPSRGSAASGVLTRSRRSRFTSSSAVTGNASQGRTRSRVARADRRRCTSPASHPTKGRSPRRDRGSLAGCSSSRLCTTDATHGSGRHSQNRQQGQPEHVLRIANRAQHRLHRVYHRMRGRGKPHNVTVVACARELACFLWAAATAD